MDTFVGPTSPTWSPWQSGLGEVLEQDSGFERPYEIPLFANAVYYPNWRVYKNQPPSSLRLGFVSHIFYAFAWVKPDGTVYLSDEWADDQMPVDGTTGCLRAFTQLKQQYSPLKILLSIGGGGAGSQHFAAVASEPLAVQNFVTSAAVLAKEYDLDGFDIDWEHPANAEEGLNYINLLQTMREQFPAPRYTLSSALPAGEWALQHIDLCNAHLYLDLINIMTYDFCGPWSSWSGHQSQLFTPPQPSSDESLVSCQSGVTYMLMQGVPANKILLGIPVYGRGFPGTTNINQPNSSAQKADSEGAVFDYCDLPLAGTTEQHHLDVVAAFCVDDQAGFVSYDSTMTVRQKARFASDIKLGGLFYWHIAADALGLRSLVATGYNALHEF